MITKNPYIHPDLMPRVDLSMQMLLHDKDIPGEHIAVKIDETALNKAQSSVEAKQAEIAVLREQASNLESEIADKRHELKEMFVSVELGELSEEETTKVEKDLKRLTLRLAEIQSQTADTVPALEVHQRTLEVLQERRKQAIYEERQRLYREHSEIATAKLKKIMQLAKQIDSEIQGFCSTAKSMMVSELLPPQNLDSPCIEQILNYGFYKVERTMVGGDSERLVETAEEKQERKHRQLQAV